jgi:nucleoside-diphosphate-sugar epimerase
VTGSAGFIGWKVSEKLLERGDQVVGIDNMNDYYDPRIKEWRFRTIEKFNNLIFYREDISNFEAMDRLFKTHPFDAVINLAARAGVRASLENPWTYYNTNVIGTLNLLECCKKYNIKKFVLASTSSLYAGENSLPFREDANTDRPLSPYAASKKAAETLCFTYHSLYTIDVTVLRYFTVYGPAGRPDMSLFLFAKWINNGSPVIVFGDGQQKRDFTFVDDIARGTLAALRPIGYEIINLGSDKPIVLIDALRLIEKVLGKKANIEYRRRHPADMLATWAGIDKAMKLLDWQPEIKFEEGVRQLLDWHQKNHTWIKQLITP